MRSVIGGRSRRRPIGSMREGMLTIGPTYHRHRGRRLIAGTGAALALGAAPATASTLVITGAGDGHGVGLSQDGALGYAQHGATYEAILAHYYSGTALGQAPAGTSVRVLVGSKVQRVPLERYVRGVVSAEMPSSWPLAALEAQAVASRTYALTAHAGGSRFDVYSDTRSQVYLGVAAETAQTNTAVTATAGQIVTYAARPAITYFFASSGGMTENIENSFIGAAPEPWLVGVADPYDSGPSFDWKLSMSFATAAARLKGLVKGTFRGIEVLRRGVSPRIVAAEVLGSGGAEAVSGPTLAARLGLESTWAYFSVKSGKTVTPEPDTSAQAPASTPSPASPAPPPAGPQGGAQAPGASGPASTTAPAGGAAASARDVTPAGGTSAG
jgi:SpoIID/LytB domain protein